MCGGVYCRKNHGICDVNRENVQGKRHILVTVQGLAGLKKTDGVNW